MTRPPARILLASAVWLAAAGLIVACAAAAVPPPSATPGANTKPSSSANPPAEDAPIVPRGWFVNGSRTADYRIGLVRDLSPGGKPWMHIQSTSASAGIDGFAGFMQRISADRYRGQRVRLVGSVRVQDATGSAAIWLRGDSEEGGCTRVLVFENTERAGATGTRELNQHSIVFDVPAATATLNFGAFLNGKGHAWVNGLRLEVVPSTVAVTTTPFPTQVTCQPYLAERPMPSEPINMDFSAEQK